MKFIRDIISEKRWMDPHLNEKSLVPVPENEPALSASSYGNSIAELETGMVEASENQSDTKAHEPLNEDHDGSARGMGVSDEFANFFDESEEPDDFEDFFEDAEPEVKAWHAPVSSDSEHTEATEAEKSDEAAPEADQEALLPNRKDQAQRDFDGKDYSLFEVFREEGITDEQVGSEAESPDQSASLTTLDHLQKEQAPEDDTATVAPPPPESSAWPPQSTQLNAESSEAQSAAQSASAPTGNMPERVEVPQPAVGRGASRHGRVKTRLLGFNTAMETDTDPMAENGQASAAPYTSFPVGWLIVVEGAGRGSAFTLFQGVSTIGRGEGQTVRLDFGDNSISRENHASIAYDAKRQEFYIGHGGKANIVRRNDRPVLSTEELAAGDLITIGETTLHFVPFCSPDFSWEQNNEAVQAHAQQG
ncbi:FHA domain-containing protein [Roseovarius aestuariivivens]|uniref:FHA domain-containing protein n=1 Tax=Roseovarius aestuariivivens TaxID=1888910 RepID=UPI001080769F|nr:FHA domain-containing protein [Roseovarius aestuariivivens]